MGQCLLCWNMLIFKKCWTINSGYCWIIGQQTIAERSGVSNETNEICTMYIEEFILVDIWIHCYASWNWTEWALEECWFIYTRNKGMRYVRITLRCTIDTGDWIELQWVRNCHLWELNWELSLHCLARSCHLEVLMVISIDTLLIKQLRKLLNVILVISNSWWQDAMER